MSRIRKYVIVHPHYANLAAYEEPETSDIVYEDLEGKLTAEFIEKGYLPRDEWTLRRPLYFIEVKTTTRSCETAFYMSQAQVKRVSSRAYHSGCDFNQTAHNIDTDAGS